MVLALSHTGLPPGRLRPRSISSRWVAAPAGALPLPFEGGQVLLSNLVDAVDVEAERARLEKAVEAKRKQVAGFQAKLGNPGYVNNAPPHLVEETRRMLQAAEADLEAAQSGLAALG